MTTDIIVQEKQVELFTNANIMASAMVSRQQETVQADAEQLIAFSNTAAEEAYNLLRIDSNQRVMVCDGTAHVIFDSAYGNNIEGKYLLLECIYTALSGKSGFDHTIGSSYYEFSAAVPVTYMGKVFGTVYIHEYSTDRAQLLTNSSSYIFLLSIFIFFLAVTLGLLFSNFLTQQIKAINVAVYNMKQGVYDKKAKILSRDELGQLAREFNELSDRLWETEEERRQFVSNASHELKTPLAAIKLLSDSILENEMDQATVKEFLTDINGEIDRLTRITEQLLKLSKTDADTEIKREPVDISEISRRVIRVLAQLMESRGITLSASINPDCIALGDSDRMYQVIINLVENAIKYNRQNGRLVVKVSNRGNRVVLLVEDTGIGIEKVDLDKIFERFYRVDKAHSRQTGGTGLGLSIVKNNVESMGGQIRVYSKVGRGSVFLVEFVRAPGNERGRV